MEGSRFKKEPVFDVYGECSVCLRMTMVNTHTKQCSKCVFRESATKEDMLITRIRLLEKVVAASDRMFRRIAECMRMSLKELSGGKNKKREQAKDQLRKFDKRVGWNKTQTE